jgi:hypothetical protein
MFGVILRVIALASNKLRLTVVRRTRRTATATASLVTVPEGAPETELAYPISRGEITERPEISAFSPGSDAHDNGNTLNFSQSESCHLSMPLARCGTRKRIPSSAVIHNHAPRTQLVDDHRLFARLALHQVRPGNRSAVAAGPQNHSSHDPKPGALSVTIANIGSPFAVGSAKCVTVAEAASSHPLPTPIETLFSELARRHLHQLAIREKP